MEGPAEGTESTFGKSRKLLGDVVLVALALMFLFAIYCLFIGDVGLAIIVLLLFALVYSLVGLHNRMEQVEKSLREIERRLESQTQEDAN